MCAPRDGQCDDSAELKRRERGHARCKNGIMCGRKRSREGMGQCESKSEWSKFERFSCALKSLNELKVLRYLNIFVQS